MLLGMTIEEENPKYGNFIILQHLKKEDLYSIY